MGAKQILPKDHIWPPDHECTTSGLTDTDYSSSEIAQTIALHLGLKGPVDSPILSTPQSRISSASLLAPSELEQGLKRTRKRRLSEILSTSKQHHDTPNPGQWRPAFPRTCLQRWASCGTTGGRGGPGTCPCPHQESSLQTSPTMGDRGRKAFPCQIL